MSKAHKFQWICILVMIVSCFVMGVHLFLFDGVTHPTHVLTVFAALFGAGMIGNLICALLRLEEERKQK